MEPPIYYSRAEFIETDTGNKVSRRATIAGPQNIILGGKTIISSGAIIRGDLRRSGPGHAVVISLGRYCVVVGDYVHIGAASVVEAATIGNYVEIGKNCIIGKFTIIKDCAKIADNTVIPPNTVIPALSLFSGSPGHFTEDLPESTQDIVEVQTKQHYARFQPLDRDLVRSSLYYVPYNSHLLVSLPLPMNLLPVNPVTPQQCRNLLLGAASSLQSTL
ncbi:dynactin subunit P25 [Lentinula edodes]|uniref:Dynactin subunit 5 n=1 Tax=Lentinula edodes TaxID=5353 RepID=A0A1Q3E0F3_LENED|nr:dynactin subunit P25 [Lentinula edodes]